MHDQLQPNLTLRRLMAEYGFTREGLATAVNDATERLTGLPGNCSARLVGRWLKGEVDRPRTHSRLPLEAVFGRPASELGFRSPQKGSDGVNVRTSSPAPPQDPPVLRRKFVLGLTGSLLTLPPLPEAGRLGMADIDRIQAAATELHQVDDRQGGAQLVDVAARYIEHVEHAARRCTYGGNVQAHLYKALGEMATSAGWFAFDADRQETARRWWDAGLRYALLAGDKLLQARIWSSLSHQAYRLRHGGEAVSIARVALGETRGRRDGQLSALLHTRVAQGHAIQNEGGWCARSLHQAEQEFDREPSEPQRWLGFFNAGEVSSASALCFLDLRQHSGAVKTAREALLVVQSTPLKRNEFAAHVRLGRCLAAAGEVDAAVAAGQDALALLPEVRSPRIEVRLKELRDSLLDCGTTGAVEFSERYEAVATCP